MIEKPSGPATASQPLENLQPTPNSSHPLANFVLVSLALLPLLLVGLTLALFFNSPLRLVQPEASGASPPAREIGQRFLVEQNGLRAIQVRLPDPRNPLAGVKLHLREAGATTDLRVVQPSAPDGLEWLRFDFAPLEASYKNRLLYFYLEAGGRPFQLATAVNNVYLPGESYFDNIAQPGDLSFELEYQPDPAALLGTYFNRQAAYNGPAWPGLLALGGWLTLACLGCFFVVWKRSFFSTENIRRLNLRRFGLLAAYFLVLSACGGLAFMFLTPPLQGLDEQGHVGRVVFVYHYSSVPSNYPLLYQAEAELEKRARYIEYVPGFDYDSSPLDSRIVPPLSESYQPPVYYAVAGGLVRLGSWLTGQESFLFQHYLVRFTSLLLGLGGLAVALAWVYYLRREAPWLFMPVPAAYAMFAPYLFISGVANNDNAVNFFVPLVILCFTILCKAGMNYGYSWPFWRRYWPVLLIMLGSMGLAYESKHTSGIFLAILALAALVALRRQNSEGRTQKAELRRQKAELGTRNPQLGTRNSELGTRNSEPATPTLPLWLSNRRLLILGLGLGLLLVAGGVYLLLRPPWQVQALVNFSLNTQNRPRFFPSLQVGFYTFESFWCSLGWVNFSDVLGGRLLLTLFLLSLLAIIGAVRFAIYDLRFAILGQDSKFSPNSQPGTRNAQLISTIFIPLALAGIGHILFLLLYRVITTYQRGDNVVEFPQGRFFLLALIPLSVLFLGGLRAMLPARLRERAPLWLATYLWLFALLVYSLIVIFGGFLPYYYNQN